MKIKLFKHNLDNEALGGNVSISYLHNIIRNPSLKRKINDLDATFFIYNILSQCLTM